MGFVCFPSKCRHKNIAVCRVVLAALCFVLLYAEPVSAQDLNNLPGPADASRIEPKQKLQTTPRDEAVLPKTGGVEPIEAAEGAEQVSLTLNSIILEGASAFSKEELRDIYDPYLGKDITLDVIYNIANKITERYKEAGYFLSLAYVPEQSITGGNVRIRVVEGYVAEVEVAEDARKDRIVRRYIKALLAEKPLTSEKMESFLLRLNDLPGHWFRAVLSPIESPEKGLIKLSLIPLKETGRGVVSADNYGSRFLGPNQVTASYSRSLMPLNETNISVLSTLPASELRYGTLSHSIVVIPDVTLSAMANKTRARPGYTLEPLEIESDSSSWNTVLTWQYMRQRQENLSFLLTLDGRNANTDFLNVPFTRDKIRALRLSANYDLQDQWMGYNIANVTISRGLKGLGASSARDINLSRAEAQPDFTKAEASITRLQAINEDFSLLVRASGQAASGALFSSEEYGYGGQSFGRAYDASEMTGDHGVSASVEVRYNNLGIIPRWNLMPYAFYDIGKLWNEDAGQVKKMSAASAGFGVRAQGPLGISANLGLAWALTEDVATPIHQVGEDGPRLMLQISKDF